AQREFAVTQTTQAAADASIISSGGAALAVAKGNLRDGGGDAMRGAYLGPLFSQPEIEARLRAAGARFTTFADDELIHTCVEALVGGKAVGWFQGRMEFGP